jgi:hypothetical protein
MGTTGSDLGKVIGWLLKDGRQLCPECAARLGGGRYRGPFDWEPPPCGQMWPVTESDRVRVAGERCSECGRPI